MQEKLLILRKRRNLTQKDMAKYLDVTVSTYARKERGQSEFNMTEMFALRKLFNRKVDDIFLPLSHLKGDGREKEGVG
jgi:putative transcriptional regulator